MMIKKLFLTMTLALSSMLSGQEPPNTAQIIAGHNQFCWKLYQELATEPGNCFVSPYSVSQALTMAYVGSIGKTKEEMQKTLFLPKVSNDQLCAINRAVLERLPTGFISAQAIAIDTSYKVSTNYNQLLQQEFKAEAFTTDWNSYLEMSLNTINNWVSDKTGKCVPKLLSEDDVKAKPKVILLNAVHFKRPWAVAFDRANTQKQPFTLRNGRIMTCDLMQTEREMNYTENDLMQLAELDYANEKEETGRYSCITILPRPGKLSQVERLLSQELLDRWLSKCRMNKVHFFLPKCTQRVRYALRKPLENLGMKWPFSQSAQFPAISAENKTDLYIDSVIHEAFLQMDEETTEAAAATAVIMIEKTSIDREKPTPVMRCDRPYFLAIQEKKTGLILFVGRIE
ncbi:MAG TPA: serpin family protein, partial [Chlamydiales bacterium]|nr:serpin family protein [Chlamydiales bacterium]